MASLLELLMGGNGQNNMQVNPMGDMTGYQNPMAKQTMEKNRYEQAVEMYPRIKDIPVQYKESISNDPKLPYLEFWPKDEPGSKLRPRPTDLPIDKYGVEVYKQDTRPEDVAADIVSHHMMNSDPTIKRIYSQFEKSMTDSQKSKLKDQYVHYITKEKEPEEKTPTFQEWKNRSGIPAWFRGYTFGQWPKDDYTTNQIKLLDKAINYLKTPE